MIILFIETKSEEKDLQKNAVPVNKFTAALLSFQYMSKRPEFLSWISSKLYQEHIIVGVNF